jgi:hypothetical protein
VQPLGPPRLGFGIPSCLSEAQRSNHLCKSKIRTTT